MRRKDQLNAFSATTSGTSNISMDTFSVSNMCQKKEAKRRMSDCIFLSIFPLKIDWIQNQIVTMIKWQRSKFFMKQIPAVP